MRLVRRIAGGVLAVALAVVAGLEIYTRTPVPIVPPELSLPPDTRQLTLIFHGSMDGENPQFPAIAAAITAPAGQQDQTRAQVRFVRWDPPANLRLRASATARSLGTQLGGIVADLPELKTLRLVAHSSGSFVPDRLCEAYRLAAARPAQVEMVLLDAFQIRGFVDWQYGARHHGRCADFALSIVNTDDPAPSTNRFLAQAFNLDVTAHPGRASYDRNGHYWPVQFFLNEGATLVAGLPGRSHDRFPRGSVVTVPGADQAGLD